MADVKISGLPASTTPLAGTEVLPIVQSGQTKKVATDDLTVKNVRSNATTGLLQVIGPAAAATRVMTTPDANFTVARTDAAQTFTGNQTFGTVLATTIDTNVAAAKVTLSGTTLAASGTDANINISFVPKGTGQVVVNAGAVATPTIAPTGDTNTGIFFPAADTIAFTEGGAESMRIDSSANVGIGTTSPSTYLAKLAVSNNANSATTGISLVNNNGAEGDGSAINFYGAYGAPYSADNIYARINGAITSFNSSKLGNLIFSTGATNSISEHMRIDSSGNLLVGITSARANAGDVQVSKGISFPATQSAQSDANTLDDYEEGTWTPALGGTATYNNRVGTYTKIGRVVTAYCLLNIALIGTGSTTTISGLPFSSATRSQGSMSYFLSISQNLVFLSPYADGASITFIGATAATASVTDGIAIFQNGTFAILAVTYYVA